LASRRAFLSLGSNLGPRERNLDAAVRALSGFLEDVRRSSIYESRPMYVEQQPKFLNMVVSGLCALQPGELLDRILSLEVRLGRDRDNFTPKGPRIIDIDILLFGCRIVEQEGLRIPHPRLKERQFVLIPLLELAPDLEDPVSNRPLAESLGALEDQGVYIFNA
jgi:2-amino-4-hydroxy-6-hydroxymethyldihydropteridine diphosphokinase